MVEAWITTLIRMGGIPLSLRINHIVTILYQIDRLTIGHTVLINQVGCGVMDDVVMLHQTVHLRAKNLGTVPVRRVGTWVSTTENNLTCTRHLPALLDSIEDIWIELILSNFVCRSFMIVNARELESSEVVFHLSSVDIVQSLTECLGSQFTVLRIIVIGLGISTALTCT